MFERLAAERRRDPSALEGWFGSHPLEQSRVKRTNDIISTIGPTRLETLVRDDPSFEAFRESVRGLGARQ